jgi:hypothetical protein
MFAAEIIESGWRSPDCYSRDYAPIPASAGVYLFTMTKFVWRESRSMPEVVYAGKSTNLLQRLSHHDVFPLISEQLPDYCLETGIHYMLQRWFLPLDKRLIGQAEINLIRKHNPAFNLQHRLKMVVHG